MRLNKTLLLISIFATLMIGCEDDTQKLTLKDARKAVKASQYDLAVKEVQKLLQLAPNEYNGLWGLADVYTARKLRRAGKTSRPNSRKRGIQEELLKDSFARLGRELCHAG